MSTKSTRNAIKKAMQLSESSASEACFMLKGILQAILSQNDFAQELYEPSVWLYDGGDIFANIEIVMAQDHLQPCSWVASIAIQNGDKMQEIACAIADDVGVHINYEFVFHSGAQTYRYKESVPKTDKYTVTLA